MGRLGSCPQEVPVLIQEPKSDLGVEPLMPEGAFRGSGRQSWPPSSQLSQALLPGASFPRAFLVSALTLPLPTPPAPGEAAHPGGGSTQRLPRSLTSCWTRGWEMGWRVSPSLLSGADIHSKHSPTPPRTQGLVGKLYIKLFIAPPMCPTT